MSSGPAAHPAAIKAEYRAATEPVWLNTQELAQTGGVHMSTMALGVIAYIKAYFAPDLEGSKLYRLFATWTAAIQLPLLAVIAGTGSLLIWRARANHSGTALL